MIDHLITIDQLILATLGKVTGSGKLGDRVIDPAIAAALTHAGYAIDPKDRGQILAPGLPVWRDKATGTIVPTPRRREIDIVALADGAPVALIEIESDLDDLRATGITNRNGHYDVHSIARRADGRYFNSYHSLERMAVAATVLARRAANRSTTNEAVLTHLDGISSNDPAYHNPLRLPLFLAVGSARRSDPGILDSRLRSLGATLIVRKFR